MSLVPSRNRTIVAAALLVPCAGSIWLLLARESMSSSTFAAVAALVLGTAAVGLNTWRNGQSTGSIGQVIHEADVNATRAVEAASANRG
jgi:hypothetical protein